MRVGVAGGDGVWVKGGGVHSEGGGCGWGYVVGVGVVGGNGGVGGGWGLWVGGV